MIEQLVELIASFPGDASCMWCFNHVGALVAKSMICQFDVPKGKADAALDDAERELRELTEGLDIEEERTKAEWEGLDDEEDEDEDDTESLVDKAANLSVADHEELDSNVRPVRLVLVKVSHRLSDDV
jgi:hypothetical protein